MSLFGFLTPEDKKKKKISKFCVKKHMYTTGVWDMYEVGQFTV